MTSSIYLLNKRIGFWMFALLCTWFAMSAACRLSSIDDRFSAPATSNNSGGSSVRVRCRVAYDGAGFNGFQYQAGEGRTVQGELEQILTRRFCRLIRVVGAGRTDAGVHARGQVVHFDLDETDFDELPEPYLMNLQKSINSMLQKNDIRVWNVSPAPKITKMALSNAGSPDPYAWHAMYSAQKKLYSYRISTAPVMEPLLRHNRWHVEDGHKLDMNRLETILKKYQGTHDFKAFGSDLMDGSVSRNVNTVRTVFSINLVCERQFGNFRIDVLLQGALYKMIRSMVGTALDVCRGRLSDEAFLHLLGPRLDNRNNAGTGATRATNPCKPAPPQGLTLEMVHYEGVQF